MKKSDRKTASSLSRRVSFPEDEKNTQWLSLLLDAYAIADTGVAVAIRDMTRKQGKTIACSEGCAVCCQQSDIPLYPHELVGIYWYAAEKLAPGIRARVKEQLQIHAPGAPCPFLLDHRCSIHPLRPLSCRQFNVFSAPCSPGEDPYYSRRSDVLVPLADYTDRCFAAVLPFYNMKKGEDTANAVRMVRAQIRNLQTFDWKKLTELLR